MNNYSHLTDDELVKMSEFRMHLIQMVPIGFAMRSRFPYLLDKLLELERLVLKIEREIVAEERRAAEEQKKAK